MAATRSLRHRHLVHLVTAVVRVPLAMGTEQEVRSVASVGLTGDFGLSVDSLLDTEECLVVLVSQDTFDLDGQFREVVGEHRERADQEEGGQVDHKL